MSGSAERPSPARVASASGYRRWVAIVATVVFIPLLVLAVFPWGLLATHAAGPLSRVVGREVRVRSAHRLDLVSLTPTIALTDVRVVQPGWAGTGEMARIAELRVRLPVLPLLIGRVRPEAIELAGARLELRRTREGRANWEADERDRPRRAGAPPILSRLVVRNGAFHLVDAGRHVELSGTIRSDAATGLAVAARGTLRGQALAVRFAGAALAGVDPHAPYPATLTVRSPLVALDAAIVMSHPLDIRRLRATVRSRGRDLTYLDDVLQAGLFPTQDYALSATVRRDGPTWHVDRVAGTVGRSRLAATATVTDRGRRTRLDADVRADAFDFADFASDAQRRRGDAEDRATGPRIIPDTDLSLRGLRNLDGRVTFVARSLLVRPGSPFRTLAATATLDRRLLTIAPLRVGLVSGRASGRVIVDDRGTRPEVALDLRIDDAAIETLVLRDDAVTGPFRGRVLLDGSGGSLRAAMAGAGGRVGVATIGGSMRRDFATFLGGDIVRGVGAAVGGSGPRVALRCIVGTLRAEHGVLTPAPLVIDDAVSRGDGGGTVHLADETLDLRFTGRARDPGPVVSTAPVRIVGTLSDPRIDMRPPRAEHEGRGGLIGRVGFFLKGLRARGTAAAATPAPPADCTGLARGALR